MASQAPILADIHLIGAFFLECAVLNDAANPVLELPPGEQRFQLHHKVEPSFILEEQYVIIDLTVHCQPMDAAGQELPVQGRFRLHLTFRVAQLGNYLEAQDPNGLLAPNQPLVLTLISVAYSTARGLIAAKTNETVLQGFVLPLLDVRDLVNSTSKPSS